MWDTMRVANAEPVFSTPDPAEAERIRIALDERHLRPVLEYGPDPVTGTGGEVFGGAGGLIYIVSVPPSFVDDARDALSGIVASANDVEPEVERQAGGNFPMARLRRLGVPILAVFVCLQWAAMILMTGSPLAPPSVAAGCLALVFVAFAVVRARARR